MDINTCLATTADYRVIAYYSHLIPVFITLILALFVLFQSKFSLLSKIFVFFTLSFCAWLLGDVVTWTSNNYNFISAVWAPLDYINIVFYLLGLYFFLVLVRGKDIQVWLKGIFFALTLPALYITVSGLSIPLFNQPPCEAFNSEFLTNYKLVLELLVVVWVIIYAMYSYHKNTGKYKKQQIVIVASALVLFFSIFSVTEYISSQTGIYEINLYSLFVLPLFLALIIYAITSLEVFRMRSIATQLLIYVLLIMIGSQFFFLKNTTDKALTILTFILSLTFSYFLMTTVRREAEGKKKIEELANQLEASNLDLATANEKLKSLDKLKTEFLSLASHQLRSPLTAIKGYSSMLIEGTYGHLVEKVDEPVKRIYNSAQGLINIVEDLLNVSKIEQGGMKYEFMPTDLSTIVTNLFNEMQIPAQSKKLDFTLNVSQYDNFMVSADPTKIKQVFLNLTDNSIKYTPAGGHVALSLTRVGDHVVFAVTDNGIGISPETRAKLFEKFSRGEGGKINTGGSGLGLYLARQIAIAHKGDVIIESEGLGKGSTFKVSLPAIGTPESLNKQS